MSKPKSRSQADVKCADCSAPGKDLLFCSENYLKKYSYTQEVINSLCYAVLLLNKYTYDWCSMDSAATVLDFCVNLWCL